MRQFICLLILSILFNLGYAQTQKVENTQYLFPEFTSGTILMKSGVKDEAMLNYNSLTGKMILEYKGKKLAIDLAEQVDTIYVAGRKFFPLNNKFVEIIYSAKYELYLEHKCELKDPGKPAGYGGTSQISRVTNYSTYSTGNQTYVTNLPEDTETNPYLIYWLKRAGKLSRFIDIRQMSKLFDERAKLFKKYVKENKVSEKDPASVVALLKYLEEH